VLAPPSSSPTTAFQAHPNHPWSCCDECASPFPSGATLGAIPRRTLLTSSRGVATWDWVGFTCGSDMASGLGAPTGTSANAWSMVNWRWLSENCSRSISRSTHVATTTGVSGASRSASSLGGGVTVGVSSQGILVRKVIVEDCANGSFVNPRTAGKCAGLRYCSSSGVSNAASLSYQANFVPPGGVVVPGITRAPSAAATEAVGSKHKRRRALMVVRLSTGSCHVKPYATTTTTAHSTKRARKEGEGSLSQGHFEAMTRSSPFGPRIHQTSAQWSDPYRG